MPSTYSALKIELIATGEQPGTWGNTTNVNLGSGGAGLEQAIVGMATLVTGDFTANSYTMPYNNNNGLQNFRALVLNITATLSGAGTVIVPAIQKPYIVMNNSVGGFAVTVKVSGQPGISVPNGAKVLLYNDGTDVGTAVTYLTTLTLGSPLAVSSGGTGQTTFTDGQLLIGNSTGNTLSKSTLTAGTGISVTNGSGSITIGNSGVTSFSAGTTGLTPSIGTTGSVTLAGTLAATNGGTGQSSYTTGDLLFASSGTALSKLADVATGNALISGGVGVAPSYGKIGLTTHVSGTLPVANGGTNITSYTTGDILYASAAGTLASLADVATGNALISGGVGVAPSYGKIGLTTHVSGTLPIGNGGTGLTTVPALSIPVANTLNTLTTVTGTAGQSIRVNAGGTAWEAYTPATGSGTVTSVSWTGGIVSIANPTTTPAFTIAGTSGGIPYFSSGTTWATSAALAANSLVIGGGAGVAPSTITTGTGVITALGVNTGSAGAFVVNGGALGTPSSGTVTNLTGTASININGTVGATTANTGNFTSIVSTSAAGILTRAAATQDGVELIGRAGGTTSLKVTLTPTTLTASRTLTLPDNSGTILTTGAVVTVAQGGTGLTTLTANNVILGNGTSTPTFVAPGTNGNVLTSNGTTWVSSAPAGGSAATPSSLGSVYADTIAASPFDTFLGYQAGNASTGARNTFIGYQAGLLNTTGTDNIAIGYQALDANTISNNSIAIGSNALGSNTNGGINIAIGVDSLRTNTDGSRNTALGYETLFSNTTGNDNVAVGYRALRANTTGVSNIAIGYGALDANTTGFRNIAVGTDALGANTTGTSNSAFGFGALEFNTTGSNNIAVGQQALSANTIGEQNVAVGTTALAANTTGTNNVAIGFQTLDANTIGTANVALGGSALGANTTGTANIAIGSAALFLNTTGFSNIAIGSTALRSNTGFYNIAIGEGALYSNTTATGNLAVGINALYATTSGGSNSAFGYNALYGNTTGSNNVAIGHSAMSVNSTGFWNVAIGAQTMTQNTAGYYNVAVGFRSMYLGTGTESTAVGYAALYTNSGNFNVAVGTSALAANTTGSENTAVGYNALDANTIGSQNTAVGLDALGANTTGVQNTAVGHKAGRSITTGTTNTAIGYQALQSNTTGNNNVAVGFGALNSNAANNNIGIGYQAGNTITTGTGNIAMGYLALGSNTTGNQNVAIGWFTYGGTGSNNTMVGSSAGTSMGTGSNNTILGGYSGNQDGLDIRNSNDYAVISDGSGNRLLSMYNGGTLALDGGAAPQAGTGITFPATQNASSNANTLDDYEEGTWTPSLGGNTTYTIQAGTYTKVGRLVTICWDVQVNVLGTGSTYVLSGMPFTSNTGITYGGSVGFFTGLASNNVSIYPRNDGNTSTLVISGLTAAGTAINNNNIFGDGARVTGCLTYIVA